MLREWEAGGTVLDEWGKGSWKKSHCGNYPLKRTFNGIGHTYVVSKGTGKWGSMSKGKGAERRAMKTVFICCHFVRFLL